MDITVDPDRLPANAGVAKQFRRGLKNQNHMAGLWEENILTGLTWSRGATTRPSLPSLGPFWSWTSVTGSINFPISRYIDAPVLNKIEFNHADGREFTDLWGGSITLTGTFVEARLRIVHTTDSPRSIVFVAGRKGVWNFHIDYIPDKTEIGNEWLRVHPQ